MAAEARTTPVRDFSPTPSLSPTPAISSCPSPDRTFSSVSSVSNKSSNSNASNARRRGYIRPQGATFAESARHRESVMCLGSIAHLQHYFARTGLLDGKGGRSKVYKKRDVDGSGVPKLLLSHQPYPGYDPEIVESPTEESGMEEEWELSDEEMLPPTVSTYVKRERRMPPPPDVEVLRLDLQASLDEAEKEIMADKQAGLDNSQETAQNQNQNQQQTTDEQQQSSDLKVKKQRPTDNTTEGQTQESEAPEAFPDAPAMPWYEIHGVQTLNCITNAIACARSYYTSHDRPERLKLISPERKIRKDLLNVLEMLRCWATRDFEGGLRERERGVLLDWVQSARDMLAEDRRLEEQEHQKRKELEWVGGDWSGKERERERAFLSYLLESAGQPLPVWEPVPEESNGADATATDDKETNDVSGNEVSNGEQNVDTKQEEKQEPAASAPATPTSPTFDPKEPPTAFLARIRDGRDLVRFHNEAVRQSKRRFGEIKSYHLDVAKPYRQTENLLFFVKACEIRWETKLDVDVAGVVNGSSTAAWRKFDDAIMRWCRVVREELVKDWGEVEEEKRRAKARVSLGPDGLAALVKGTELERQ